MEVKNKGGRPTKYKPEYCEELIKHMSDGYSYESFAANLFVNVDSLYEWEKVHKEFSDAKKIGVQRCKKWWETLGRSGIGGKVKGFSTSGWIFVMKCRFGYKDGSETGPQTDIKDNSNMIWSTNWRGAKPKKDAEKK